MMAEWQDHFDTADILEQLSDRESSIDSAGDFEESYPSPLMEPHQGEHAPVELPVTETGVYEPLELASPNIVPGDIVYIRRRTGEQLHYTKAVYLGDPGGGQKTTTTNHEARPAMDNTPAIRNGGFGALQVEAVTNQPLSIARRHLAASQLRMRDVEPDQLSQSEWVRFLAMPEDERQRWISQFQRQRRESAESARSSSHIARDWNTRIDTKVSLSELVRKKDVTEDERIEAKSIQAHKATQNTEAPSVSLGHLSNTTLPLGIMSTLIMKASKLGSGDDVLVGYDEATVRTTFSSFMRQYGTKVLDRSISVKDIVHMFYASAKSDLAKDTTLSASVRTKLVERHAALLTEVLIGIIDQMTGRYFSDRDIVSAQLREEQADMMSRANQASRDAKSDVTNGEHNGSTREERLKEAELSPQSIKALKSRLGLVIEGEETGLALSKFGAHLMRQACSSFLGWLPYIQMRLVDILEAFYECARTVVQQDRATSNKESRSVATERLVVSLLDLLITIDAGLEREGLDTAPTRRPGPITAVLMEERSRYLTQASEIEERLFRVSERSKPEFDIHFFTEQSRRAHDKRYGEMMTGREDEPSDLDDPSEHKYCYCLRGSHGVMVACDGPNCRRKWFHLSCTDLERPLSDYKTWFCIFCQPPVSKTAEDTPGATAAAIVDESDTEPGPNKTQDAGEAANERPPRGMVCDNCKFVWSDTQMSNSSTSANKQPNGLPCLFDFLNCSMTFTDVESWNEHCKSHFKGKAPPKQLRCPYSSCAWTTSREDGEDAWNQRLEHLVHAHDVLSYSEVLFEKPDVQLFKYLWTSRIITDAQLQELRKHGRVGSHRSCPKCGSYSVFAEVLSRTTSLEAADAALRPDATGEEAIGQYFSERTDKFMSLYRRETPTEPKSEQSREDRPSSNTTGDRSTRVTDSDLLAVRELRQTVDQIEYAHYILSQAYFKYNGDFAGDADISDLRRRLRSVGDGLRKLLGDRSDDAEYMVELRSLHGISSALCSSIQNTLEDLLIAVKSGDARQLSRTIRVMEEVEKVGIMERFRYYEELVVDFSIVWMGAGLRTDVWSDPDERVPTLLTAQESNTLQVTERNLHRRAIWPAEWKSHPALQYPQVEDKQIGGSSDAPLKLESPLALPEDISSSVMSTGDASASIIDSHPITVHQLGLTLGLIEDAASRLNQFHSESSGSFTGISETREAEEQLCTARDALKGLLHRQSNDTKDVERMAKFDRLGAAFYTSCSIIGTTLDVVVMGIESDDIRMRTTEKVQMGLRWHQDLMVALAKLKVALAFLVEEIGDGDVSSAPEANVSEMLRSQGSDGLKSAGATFSRQGLPAKKTLRPDLQDPQVEDVQVEGGLEGILKLSRREEEEEEEEHTAIPENPASASHDRGRRSQKKPADISAGSADRRPAHPGQPEPYHRPETREPDWTPKNMADLMLQRSDEEPSLAPKQPAVGTLFEDSPSESSGRGPARQKEPAVTQQYSNPAGKYHAERTRSEGRVWMSKFDEAVNNYGAESKGTVMLPDMRDYTELAQSLQTMDDRRKMLPPPPFIREQREGRWTAVHSVPEPSTLKSASSPTAYVPPPALAHPSRATYDLLSQHLDKRASENSHRSPTMATPDPSLPPSIRRNRADVPGDPPFRDFDAAREFSREIARRQEAEAEATRRGQENPKVARALGLRPMPRTLDNSIDDEPSSGSRPNATTADRGSEEHLGPRSIRGRRREDIERERTRTAAEGLQEPVEEGVETGDEQIFDEFDEMLMDDDLYNYAEGAMRPRRRQRSWERKRDSWS
jgi:hypothetical protein